MDVTVVNTPLPVSAEIKVKTSQIPFNLIIPKPAAPLLQAIPPQSLVIKEANTDYDLVINYVYAGEAGPATVSFGPPAQPPAGFGLIIIDSKRINIQLSPNATEQAGVMTSIVVTKNQQCVLYLGSPTTNDSGYRANFFVSGFIYRQ